MAKYGTLVPQLSTAKGNVNEAYGIPEGDLVFPMWTVDENGNPVEILFIFKSTLTGAAAFNGNAGYISTKVPIGSRGWDSAGTVVTKSAHGAAGWA